MTLPGAFQSGTVTGFSGASGLLQELLDFVAGTKVEGASLSGSGAGPYTATLTTTVGLGSTIVSYTIGGTDYTAQDDGAGSIEGTNVSSGTINHSTGALSITFTSTPTGTPTVDYVYGNDGQDWEIKYQRNTRDNNEITPDEPFGSDCKEVILHNRGLSGGENVLIGIREWKYVSGNAYGWDLTGYTSYTDDQFWGKSNVYELTSRSGYSSTYEHWSQMPMLPLIDDTMYYWFYSNRQRIIVVVKVQSNYESCYLGFANRYGNPSDYPYPLVIKGSSYGDRNYTETSETYHAYIPYSPSSNQYLMVNVLPSNAWSLNISSYYTYLYPWTYWTDTGSLYQAPSYKEVLMTPVIGINKADNYTLWELDGVYHVAGVGVQSEDFIRAFDGIKYRAFQNVSRVDYDDFMGVAETEYTTTSTSTTSTTSTTSSTCSTTSTTSTSSTTTTTTA